MKAAKVFLIIGLVATVLANIFFIIDGEILVAILIDIAVLCLGGIGAFFLF